MKKTFTGLSALVLAGAVGSTTLAQEDAAIEAALKARQSHMQLYAFNIGLLGGMAKGEIEYDADTASAAAGNLAALAKLDQSRYWPEGSSTLELSPDQTSALPDIWDDDSDIGEKAMDLVEATAEMETAAGDGLDSLRGAIGAVGESCSGCHKPYRQSDD
ncbi:MAG: Cytochrome c556 [Rhodobacteraceae bacterium HLUCCO07]|nr:MAG: Cytochrome c556 [Rhodobacteraceae bacterium HLUCCO07]